MFNSILQFTQEKLKFLYKNSLFLQHIDTLILLLICAVFVTSTFMSSDSIGFLALITLFLTVLKILVVPGQRLCANRFETWLVAYFMIVTGESTGELADMMGKVSKYYQEQHSTMVSSLKSFIEPVMIAGLAIVVGIIILAVIMPMYGMYDDISM